MTPHSADEANHQCVMHALTSSPDVLAALPYRVVLTAVPTEELSGEEVVLTAELPAWLRKQ